MMERVVFDGIDLSEMYQIAAVVTSAPSVQTETQKVTGMDGVVVLGSTLSSVSIVVYLILNGRELSERKEELRELFGMLDSTEEHRLYISSDNGRYYMAKLDGEQITTDKVRSSRVALRFMAASPYLHGETQRVTVPSGGEVTFKVGGTHVTYPRVYGTVTRDASTQLWGLRLDGVDVMQVPMSVTQGTLEIDCEDMSATFNNATAMITPQSHWFELSAGTHRIENYLGSGSCTVEWETIWL